MGILAVLRTQTGERRVVEHLRGLISRGRVIDLDDGLVVTPVVLLAEQLGELLRIRDAVDVLLAA